MGNFSVNRGGLVSYEKRKKKRLTRRIIRITWISMILIYIIIRTGPILLAGYAKTILPEKGVLIKKDSYEAVVIKNEKVFNLEGSEMNPIIKEGERVPAGTEIADVSLILDNSTLKRELQEVENAIEALSRTESDNEILKSEQEKLEIMQTSLVEDIQKNISISNYAEIGKLKEELMQYNTKNKDVSFSNTLISQSLDNLYDRRDKLIEEIDNSTSKYYSSNAGIVSYKVDGYESILLPKEFENYTYESLNFSSNDKNTKDKDEKSSISSFKVVDNHEFYLAIKIDDNKDIDDYKVNNSITIQLEEDKDITGKIVCINNSGNKSVIVLLINDYVHEYYDLRFSDVNIIKYRKEGLKLPTKVITEKDGQKGVYIKEISGIVKFRPVSLLGEVDDYTYIDKGNINGNIVINGKEYRTVSLYDEVFLNFKNIKEGQILY